MDDVRYFFLVHANLGVWILISATMGLLLSFLTSSSSWKTGLIYGIGFLIGRASILYAFPS